MPSKHDERKPAEPESDSRELASSPEKPQLRSQTISVTIPTSHDDELDDDDVIRDDVVKRVDSDPATGTSAPAATTAKSDPKVPSPTPAAGGVGSAQKAAPRQKKAAASQKSSGSTPAPVSPAMERPKQRATEKQTSSAPAGSSAKSSAGAGPATSGTQAAEHAASSAPAASARPEETAQVKSMSARQATNGGSESASMLTAERLLDDRSARGRAPDGGIQRFVYRATGQLVNLGDSRKARARKDLTHRIAKPFAGAARFVPVITRKGGVGKTTVSLLLGMALADAREDRVIAIDANADRGTLCDRVRGTSDYTVRDAIRRTGDITGYTEFSTLVARDETRLDVLASETDPAVASALSDADYGVVASLASQYYSMIITDSGAGMVHDVMRATLDHADSVVIVSGTSIDEARLTSETISWLEANGHTQLAKNAVVAINSRTSSRSMVKLDELDAHFSSRVRAVTRIPYDPVLASGAAVDFDALRPETRHAARLLAASVVDGLPAQRPTLAVQ
ncbi:MinD/ParA family ATP-binding protein [Paramicrobacterium agarici]|uniref:MinD/ParA family ATP-binding protein n=1 Tax=Paramicrobacterium agarici TaxID=630514 RepID=UPI00116ECD73|nr:MinD/ParA family protein [Microbacterium agarici]TQO21358.1 MinD-like ATPase involved in chromosome partitioning or flagellar assembly [Microbacterium agarici]